MDNKIKSALDAAGTAADYSARATYQRGYDAGVIDAKNTISVCGECDAALARADAAEARAEVAIARAEKTPSAYAMISALLSRASAAEAREWALGVQVVAQAQRLRLAEAVVDEARYGQPTLAMRQALAAWDTVPGMEP